MSDATKTQLKKKIKKVMMDHLTSIGYPDISDEQIMSQLKPMWIKLEEAQLIQTGMNYNSFAAEATNALIFAQISNFMR